MYAPPLPFYSATDEVDQHQIFGATGHLGRSLVRAATSHGDKVTAVGWTKETSTDEMKSWMVDNSLGMLCDVRVRETVDAVVNKSIEHWGKVDIIAKYDYPAPTSLLSVDLD